jgi:hypothetical protein
LEEDHWAVVAFGGEIEDLDNEEDEDEEEKKGRY